MGSALATSASCESFGEQLPQHVSAGAFFFGREGVHLGERVRVEPDRDLGSRVPFGHDSYCIPLHDWDALGYSLAMTTTQTTQQYLGSIADNFPARDSRGYVVGFYVYAGYGVAQKRESGPFPTEAEAAEWAGKVVAGRVVCGHVFTATGKIVHAPVEAVR